MPPKVDVNQSNVEKLLLHVARGEQDEAEAMLKIKGNKALLLHKGKVTDYSHRTFNAITAFQYALWALDWHMWKMLKKYLPDGESKQQLEDLETNATEHGQQYDFTPLIQAFKAYIDQYDTLSKKKNWQALRILWTTGVGGAQTQIPAHVANEYCRRDRPFDPKPSFLESTLPRTFDLYEGNKYFSLAFYSDGSLSSDFAIYRGGFSNLEGVSTKTSCKLANRDLARLDLCAISGLCEVRKGQYQELKNEIKQSAVPLLFFELLESPDQFTLLKLNKLFDLVTHVAEFKFPYTLANIARESNIYPASEINQIIFAALEKLADRHIYSEEIAVAFKLILDSAFRKKIISKEQQYLLDRKAEKCDTFSDKRFVDLKMRVSQLERQVAHLQEISYQHGDYIQQIAHSVSDLKQVMKQQAQRKMLCSVAKMALCFVGAPLVDMFSNMVDLSDIAEITSAVLHVDIDTIHSLASDFTEHVDVEKLKHTLVNQAAVSTLDKMGLSPDEYINIWAKTTLTLRVNKSHSKSESRELQSSQVQPLSSRSALTESSSMPRREKELSRTSRPAAQADGSAVTAFFSDTKISPIKVSSEFKAYIEKLAIAGYIFKINQQSNLRQIDIECIKMNMQDSEIDEHPLHLVRLLKNDITSAGLEHVEVSYIQDEDKVIIQGNRGAIKNIKQLLESVAGHLLSVDREETKCLIL